MKDSRCILGFHSYFTNHAPDRSTVYLECRRCGKVKDFPDPNAIAALGPPGGGA